MKFLILTLLSATQVVHSIRLEEKAMTRATAKAKALASTKALSDWNKPIAQTCDSSLNRLKSQSNMTFGSSTPFKDQSFAGKAALQWDYSPKSDKEMEKTYKKVIGWKTPTELDGSTPSLWGSKGVRPAAIVQGELGDCWFLSAMAAISEEPSRIKSVFKTEDYPSDGKFTLDFYNAGTKYAVTVDDTIPVQEGNKTINLSKSPNGAWWGPIMEKAGAKFYGRYENMNGGQTAESLYALTGMPTFTITNKASSSTKIWKILSEADQMKYIMTGAVIQPKGFNLHGLVNGHAFTLLGVNTYKTTKLVKIRNPWGAEQYSGPWSDKSSEMTPEARKALGTPDENDGIFWMDLATFESHFSRFTVAMFQDWKQDKKEMTFNRSSNVLSKSISFTNSVEQRAVVGMTGNSQRMFRDKNCVTKEMIDTIYLYLNRDDNAHQDTTNMMAGSTFYTQLSAQTGQGWLIFEKLLTGEYTFSVGQFSNSPITKNLSSPMPITIQTFGATTKLEIK